jgi:microcompartment protein CcmL/EutN
MSRNALGLIETMGFVGVTEAADAAVKAAAVEIAVVEKVDGGLVSVQLLGDVAAVQAAVQAGAAAAERVGQLLTQHVIPNPHEDLFRAFHRAPGGTRDSGGTEGSLPDDIDLESLSVTELRRLARMASGLTIQGREISRANREQLIEELQRSGYGTSSE